ncbi:MAG: RNA polymerase sigma-70 factor [Candidatus Pseudobacter hemicellulosilyticus]|uniref:RNA polymerase sigma-70 factor n=1 Tax=Candidatus Pseudobacter hemicellulosilyticus TaxID=3121375 RepID=A0AAJ6BGB0_9BACT|nr:MAG: RNA polymerase sigma-70 factor [Pseudobacter sp.]
MSQADQSDSSLWNAIRQNDPHAFNLLFDRYWVPVYKTANKYLNDKAASQEIVHDIFLSIWTRRHTLQVHSFPAFLLTATRYQVYSRKKERAAVVVSDELPENMMAANSADNDIRQAELYDQLQQILLQLPARCQEIFRLSRFEYMTSEEIAQRLGISKRTVENQLTHALRHVRVHLKDMVLLIVFLAVTGQK